MLISSTPNQPQFSDDPAVRCRQIVTNLRLVTFALFMGLLIVSGIFAFLVYGMLGVLIVGAVPVFGPGLPGLTLLGLLILAAAVLAGYFVPRAMVAAFQRKLGPTEVPPVDRFVPDENDFAWTRQVPKEQLFVLLVLFLTHRIVRLAFFEGAGVVNAVFFMLEGEVLGLIAVATSLVLIASQFPSPAALNRWLRETLAGPSGAARLD